MQGVALAAPICYWLLGMRKCLRASVVALATAAIACAQPNAPDPAATEIPIQRLRAEPYAFEFFSGLDESERLLIRNTAAWADVWSRIYARRGEKPALPTVDFAAETIVVVALGQRPSSGYSIIVKNASRAGGVTTVGVESLSPGPGCGGLTVLTHPVDIARIPRLAGFVQFEETAVVRDCR